MEKRVSDILNSAKQQIENATTIEQLTNLKVKYLGRNSELTNIKKNIKNLSNDEKRVIGPLSNKVSVEIESLLKEKYDFLYSQNLNAKLLKERVDVTLPSGGFEYGKKHPISRTIDEIVSIFEKMGFSKVENQNSPEVETEYFNFDMLNFPKDHPAKDMQDTFYTDVAPNVILRSQTSNSQIRQMLSSKPPIKVVSPGRVYRCEAVSARKNNLFYQIEGLLIDKDINFSHLKGILNEFITLYFGHKRKTRFRSSFFPFTEPSAEVDVQCIICHGKGCRVCSNTGWLEVLGSGMVDPNVLVNVGINPQEYSGFAFGMGVERLCMLKWAIDDIRLFYNNDLRFLKQF